MAWRPDGSAIALGGYREARLVDAASRKPIATLAGHAEAVRAVAFSRDGKWLAAAGGLPARAGEVKLWDVASKTLSQTFTGHADCIYAVAFSPDGTMLATASYDKLIKLWDMATAKEIRTLRDHIDAVYALAFTPGRHAAGIRRRGPVGQSLGCRDRHETVHPFRCHRQHEHDRAFSGRAARGGGRA